MKIVLQKFISQSGYCSRRKAEELIRDKKVKVNEELAELGMKAGPEDEVLINGKIIKPIEEKIYIILNKPVGYTCTNRKFKGEKNVFELLPVNMRYGASLHVVGRLDKDSRGLVLLTNDGDLTQKLAHPSYQHEKKYRIELQEKNIDHQNILKRMKNGIDIEDGRVRAKDIKYLKNNIFLVTLTQGKKRQLRKMFEAMDYHIHDLLRVSIGKLELKDLKEGTYKFIEKKDII